MAQHLGDGSSISLSRMPKRIRLIKAEDGDQSREFGDEEDV